MIKIMVLFSLFSVLGDFFVNKKKSPYPEIVESYQKKNASCKEDPLTPCMFEVIVIKNPLVTPVEVIVSCSVDLNEVNVVVPARTRLTLEIEITAPSGGYKSCSVVKWKTVK